MKGKTDARFPFDQGTRSCHIGLKTYNKIGKSGERKKKEKQQITRAAPSHTSSGLHAAVILYFAAPGCAHTVSDRDWCKINTSQECDVLIKSLCCSDRGARRVRGGLQRRPLWSCQVWPSKADEAVRLLICLCRRAPSPPRKPSPLSVSLTKKYARLQRRRPRGRTRGRRPNTF